MPCPIAAAMTVTATLGGVTTLVVHDLRFRRLSQVVAVALMAAWVAYFAWFRTPTARLVLEVASVAALLAGIARVVWLVRREGMTLPVPAPMRRVTNALIPAFASPGALVVKTWLAAMVVMEWRGKAHFGLLEYSIVAGVLVAVLIRGVLVTRRAPARFATLEALARRAPVASCPLGFGCAPEAAATPGRASAMLDTMAATPVTTESANAGIAR